MAGFAAARCAGRAARYRKTLAIELHQQGLTLKTGNRELHGVRHPLDVLGKDAWIRQRVQATFETIAQHATLRSTRIARRRRQIGRGAKADDRCSILCPASQPAFLSPDIVTRTPLALTPPEHATPPTTE